MSTPSTSTSTKPTRRTTLLTTSHAFCAALLSPPHPTTLLTTYFTSNPRITEHGPSWAQSRLPFLSKTFTGLSGCEQYFSILSSVLEMQLPPDAFPGPEGFIVDENARCEGGEEEGQGSGMVSVVGKGTFRAKKTGKEWDETFIHRFSGFDAEGRIGHWEIWADPLSAWEAVGGGED